MPPRKFAERTDVSVDKSLGEIKSMLRGHGADRIVHDEDTAGGRVSLCFQRFGRAYRLTVPLPNPKDPKITRTPQTGKQRAPDVAREAYEQELRRRHRCLALAVKSRLIEVDEGLWTFEQVFMMQLMVGPDDTMADALAPKIEEAAAQGKLHTLGPRLLMLGHDGDQA